MVSLLHYLTVDVWSCLETSVRASIFRFGWQGIQQYPIDAQMAYRWFSRTWCIGVCFNVWLLMLSYWALEMLGNISRSIFKPGCEGFLYIDACWYVLLVKLSLNPCTMGCWINIQQTQLFLAPSTPLPIQVNKCKIWNSLTYPPILIFPNYILLFPTY